METILSKEAGGYDLYRINEEGKRVTFASTQDYKQKLSLKNCQAIERGYDLDELAFQSSMSDGKEHSDMYRYLAMRFFKEGFQKALELMGDKKFSEVNMEDAYYFGSKKLREEYLDFIKTFQKTEWDVEVQRQCLDPNCDGINRKGECIPGDKPRIDSDGCLILKRL